MDYLRGGTGEQSSDLRPSLKSYSLGKVLGGGRKLGGQDGGKDLGAVRIGELRKGAVRIRCRWKGELELGVGEAFGI